MFEYIYIKEMEEVRKHIQDCEGKHSQQVVYSTFHDCLTQICFGCLKIRTSMYRPELIVNPELLRKEVNHESIT